jgi:hypothetical protein
MHGNRSFLMLGGDAPADIKSLTEGGYELANYRFSLQQGIDRKGKATTRVYGGQIHLLLTQMPPKDIMQWGLASRMRKDGAVILLDYDNVPVEKVIFNNAICSEFEFDYVLDGSGYCQTRMAIQAEIIILEAGVTIDNEWNED